MYRVQALEVDVAAIHHVVGASLDRQDVEHVDVMQLAIADMDEGRDRASQIEQRVQLDGSLGGAERRPVEQVQAQIDGGGVERIDTGIEFQHGRLLGVECLGAGDQPLCQGVVDAPVTQVQRIGQRRARRRRRDPHVEQLGPIGCQASLDVAQRLAPGELREGHDAEHLGTTQGTHARIAPISCDDALEGLPRHELHDLREQRLAYVHASLRVLQTSKHRKQAIPNSNRGHPGISQNPRQHWLSGASAKMNRTLMKRHVFFNHGELYDLAYRLCSSPAMHDPTQLGPLRLLRVAEVGA